MRAFFFILLFSPTLFADTIVTAKIQAIGCVDKELIQVIAIKKDVANQFMYQVGVPHLGTADFNFIPGEYRLEAISDLGCFGKKEFSISEDQKVTEFVLELKK